MNLVTNWLSNNDRPKDTIGRILASAPPGTIEITQTKKPKSLLKPWMTREKELKIIIRPEDSDKPAYPSRTSPSTKPLPSVKASSTTKSPASVKSKSLKKPGRSLRSPVRPASASAPPSYDTAVALKKEEETGGVVQAGVMSGVGMAALYCAKMAWDMYSSSPGETKEEEEEGEDEEKERKLGWLGV